jgi:S-adenosylhomocysteine hydrolase
VSSRTLLAIAVCLRIGTAEAAPALEFDSVARRLSSTKAVPLLRRLSGAARRGGEENALIGDLRQALRKDGLDLVHRADSVHLGRAVLDLLDGVTDGHGVVDQAAFARRYGRDGRALLLRLARLKAPDAHEAAGIETRTTFLPTSLRARLRDWFRPRVRPVMRAFQRFAARRTQDRPLFGYDLFAVQHLLGSTRSMLDAFADAGIEPQHMSIVGKRYSQSWAVINHMHEERFAPMAGRMPGGPDSGEIELALREWKRRNATSGRKLLLIDDGGELIRYINDHHPDLHDRVVAVEQTRRGIRALEKLTLKFPVIDVAQCWAKLEKESPMIGHSIARETHAALERLREQGIAPGQRVLLIGYGSIGRHTALALRRLGYQVEAHDEAAAAIEQAKKDGQPLVADKLEALRRADVVISMTGTTTVSYEELSQLPGGKIFINGASSNDELDWRVREWSIDRDAPSFERRARGVFRGKSLDLGDLVDGAHRHRLIFAGSPDAQHLLLNDGAPINFTGGVDPIPPRYIQLTRGLLFLAGLQASVTRRPGIFALWGNYRQTDPPGAQEELVREVEAELAETGESLDAPRF